MHDLSLGLLASVWRASAGAVSKYTRARVLLANVLLVTAGCSSRDAIPDYDFDASVGPEECQDAPDGTECGAGQICVTGTCQDPECGDGVRAEDEECDDGNQTDDDGCTNGCQLSVCGNGYVEPYEDCDDFNTRDGDRCPANCRDPQPYCGDRVIDEGEACDGPQVGITGVSESYSCSNDCKAKVTYVCQPCQEARCTAYTGRGEKQVNAVAGCLSAVDTANGAMPREGFLEQCAALVNCALRNRCGVDGNFASVGCYCGATGDEACAESGPEQPGPCHEEFAAAAGSTDGATIFARLIDFAHPVAWAGALLDCYRDRCLGPLKATDGTEDEPPVFVEPVEGVETSCFPL